MPDHPPAIPVLRREYLATVAPAVVVVAVGAILPFLKAPLVAATAMLMLAAGFLFAAWRLITLRRRLDSLRRRMLDSDARLCIGCGYALDGVDATTGDCPECGRPYEIAAVQAAWRAARFRTL